MRTTRHGVLTILVMAAAVHPAFAETCNLTIQGRKILDDESCTVGHRAGVLTLRQENGGTVVVRRSTLLTDVAPIGSRKVRNSGRSGLRSLGLIVKSDNLVEKVCFFNQNATFCVER